MHLLDYLNLYRVKKTFSAYSSSLREAVENAVSLRGGHLKIQDMDTYIEKDFEEIQNVKA